MFPPLSSSIGRSSAVPPSSSPSLWMCGRLATLSRQIGHLYERYCLRERIALGHALQSHMWRRGSTENFGG